MARGHLIYSQLLLAVIALLLAVIATVLITGAGGQDYSVAWAQRPPIVGARGIFALTANAGNEALVFLFDVDQHTICVYRYVPTGPEYKRFRLVAARSFYYDRMLTEYNCEQPLPSEIKQLVGKQKSAEDSQQNPPDRPK